MAMIKFLPRPRRSLYTPTVTCQAVLNFIINTSKQTSCKTHSRVCPHLTPQPDVKVHLITPISRGHRKDVSSGGRSTALANPRPHSAFMARLHSRPPRYVPTST